MEKEMDTKKALRGTPRPHYLVDEAKLEHEGERYVLTSKVRFPSDEQHPSVLDRSAGRYLPGPHVNIGDSFFAFWNAAHVIGDEAGYSLRTLVDTVSVDIGTRPLRPDTDYTLRLDLSGKREGRKVRGTIRGEISHENEKLVGLEAKFAALKKE